MSDKKFQIFISSTFTDLKEERRHAIEAILSSGHFPVGMELFPASNDESWTYIQQVIDDCDLYMLILAGRYGSVDQNQIGFTEKEFKYAINSNKYVMAFLHRDPEMIMRSKTDGTDEAFAKLQDFRKKVQTDRLCAFYSTPTELQVEIFKALPHAIKASKASGWIRGNTLSSEESLREIIRLRDQVSQLERELVSAEKALTSSSSEYADGEDEYELIFAISTIKLNREIRDVYPPFTDEVQKFQIQISKSWNEIFQITSLLSIGSCSETSLQTQFISLYSEEVMEKVDQLLREEDVLPYEELGELEFDRGSLFKIKIQFLALGYIDVEVFNGEDYWKLTEQGRRRLIDKGAIRKK